MTANDQPRILTVEPAALPAELTARTDVLPQSGSKWWIEILERFGLSNLARRIKSARRSWRLFRLAPSYAAVITLGDFEGLLFAWLQRLHGGARPVHVMYDCLWYGGSKLKRWWMRSCLQRVDRCVVWASVECRRYSQAYGVPVEKFIYVPHHHTLHHYSFQAGDDGYVFTGGNADRDYAPFLAAVRELQIDCILATNRPQILDGLQVPSNVRVVSVPPAEFRQLMARASIVVMPMKADLLHAGAQQTVLNAMLMGKPVILTDPEGGADYVQNGVTGVLVPYGDVVALRQAIQGLMASRDKARTMSERARAAAAPFTTERTNTMIWTLALQRAGEYPPAAALASVSGNPAPHSDAETYTEAKWGAGR
jgi:glycosyltransferase involved in cell wall biosynthesis